MLLPVSHIPKVARHIIQLGIFLLLASCGGGGAGADTAPNAPHATISGTATKGTIRNGTVRFEELRSGAWVEVGNTTSDQQGHFQVVLDAGYRGGPLHVTVSAHATLPSTMVCDRRAGCGTTPFGQDMPLGGLTLSALHPGGLATTSNVSLQITPFTQAASEAAIQWATARSAPLTAALINAFNQAVGRMLGGIDILHTPPATDGATPSGRQYAFLTAAVANLAYTDATYAATTEPIQTAVARLAGTVATGSVPVDDSTAVNPSATISINELFAAAITEATPTDSATVTALGTARTRVTTGLATVPLLGDADGDGVLDYLDRCAATPAGTTVGPDGCPAFSVGGTVTGLAGTVVLRNNGGDDLTLTGNGPFAFPTRMAGGASYVVTVRTQPAGQTCAVTGGTGTMAAADVTGITIACANLTAGNHTVGGTVSGLVGTMVLRNNGTDDLTVTGNGPFTFPAPLANAQAYSVTIAAAPGAQTCTVAGGAGSVSGANVTTVTVTCAATADETAYQAALAVYRSGDFVAAQAAFDAFVTTWTPSGSARLANAQYYLARSIHEQAKTALAAAPSPAAANVAVAQLATARTAYARVNTIDPASSLVDDAAYQSAATYFDAGDYLTGLGELNAFLTVYRTLGSNRIDNAQYLAARSIHERAVVRLSRAVTTADTNAAMTGFADARAAYARFPLDNPASTLIDNAAYYNAISYFDAGDFATAITALSAFMVNHPLSTLRDDAQYYLARTMDAQATQWLNQALTQADVDAAQLRFADARAEYDRVAVVDPASTLIDNAAFHVAQTHYNAGDMATAITALNGFATAHPLSSLLDDARYFVGRAIHNQASRMLALARTQADVDAALLRFADARAEYARVPVINPASSLADNAAYQTALTRYHAGEFALAITDLSAFITQYGPTLSTLLDDARYYIGRSIHGEAADLLAAAATQPEIDAALLRFADARAEYAKVALFDPASSLLDNADYQAAITYFDADDPITAISELTRFLNGYGAAGSSLADNAQYFIGRAIHKDARALLAAALPLDAAARFAQARTAYQLVICDTGEVACPYVNSTLEDDAWYQVGKTFYDEASYLQAIPAFQTALTQYPLGSAHDDARYYMGRAQQRGADPVAAEATFRQLLAESPFSIYADNAQYFMAITFHDRQLCVTELTEMRAVVSGYPWSGYALKAQTHIDDLILIPPLTHICL